MTTQTVHAAFEVLERSGIAVYSKSAREAFAKAKATVDEDTGIVKLPRSLVEDAIASNPSSITLFGRDGAYDCVLEQNRVHYGTGGTAIYVLDPKTGEHRPSTVEDVALNARMVEQLRLVSTALRMVPVSPAVHVGKVVEALDAQGGFSSPSLQAVLDAMVSEVEWYARTLAPSRVPLG